MIDRMLRERLVDAYLATIPIVTLNLIWFLASLPLVTALPAAGGLFYATNRLAHGHSASWRTFVEGFRRYFWQSWAWGILNLLVSAILVANWVFYSAAQSDWTTPVHAVIALLALVWLAVQINAFPLLIEQEHPHLRLAFRNSVVILIKRPFSSLGAALVIAVIALISSLIIQPAWIFVSAGTCAYLANRAALGAIARITGKPLEQPEQE